MRRPAARASRRAPASRLQRTLIRLRSAALEQISPESLSSVLHVLALVALVIVLRPIFASVIGGNHYEAQTVVTSLIEHDINLLTAAAQRHRPVVPLVLFLVLPTAFFWATKRRLRWTDWQHGRSLRALVMAILFIVVYAGSTFDYNVLLQRGHPYDRLLLVVLWLLSWRYPLAVPFAVRWGIIMIREAYHPIVLDDFEYRAVTEVLIVFAAFVWASAKKTFQPWHFLVVALGSWASYYYVAAGAKWDYGPEQSWLWENHLTHLAISAHIRGWLGFVDDNTFLAIASFIKQYDRALSIFTLIVEFGALVAFFIHRKTAQIWFVLLIVLNLGIFVMTGICFWKWIMANLAFAVWSSRGGRPVFEKMCSQKLVVLLGILLVYYADKKIWFWPQKGVSWYDTQLIDQYDIYAVGVSGKKYIVDPNYFAPQDMHFVQGNLCYATDGERGITSIYGTTGGYTIMKALNEFEEPFQALALHRRGRVCSNPKQRAVFDAFMRRFFGNVNRHGRPYDWLSALGRPHHLWVHSQGHLYDEQEPVEKVELWRRTVYAHGDRYHELESKLAHTVEIP
jgi:hypothetical protein